VFVRLFKQYYEKIHQFNTNAVRNIGKLFGHLFACGILPIEECWDTIEMTEDGTTSAGRIFIKFVFQELVEEVGIGELVEMVEAENVQ
jgi:pre-mRNA-splicing factor CWC22